MNALLEHHKANLNVVLEQHKVDLVKTIELAQGRKKLLDERKKNANLEKGLEKVKLGHNINREHRIRAEENQRRAKNERKEMEKCLATVVVDRIWAEDVLAATRERTNKAVADLLALQERRRISEKIWVEEVSRLRG